MNAWQSEASKDPAWIGFPEGGSPQQSGMVPIYFLADSALQAQAKKWWLSYLNNNHWITNVGNALCDININGDPRSSAKGITNTRQNNKYKLLPSNNAPLDLNLKAGGWYIYLGVFFSNFELVYNGAITDLKTITGENAVAPPGWTKFPADLNRGAGGEYIYLCVEHGNTEKTPIRDISVVALDKGFTGDNYNGWEVVKDASGGNKDLNCRAGGKYIYLLISRQ